MNYYINGNAAKAEQIKAAFEKLGYDTGNLGFTSSQLYYTIEGKVELICTRTLQNLIKTHHDYQELQLPVEPRFKVGDWLVYKDHGTFCGGLRTVQIQTVEKNRYVFTHGTDGSHRFIDDECRLWTTSDIKDGDVLMTTSVRNCPFIYRKTDNNNNLAYYYAGVDGNGDFCEGCLKRTLFHFGPIENVVPATKEQRDLLFAKMKEEGYEWDAGKKELKKIQSHYDIANFHAGMPVLVRDYDNSRWSYVQFSHYVGECRMKFNACGIPYIQCVPFNDDTKHLLGTTDPCDEQYINW